MTVRVTGIRCMFVELSGPYWTMYTTPEWVPTGKPVVWAVTTIWSVSVVMV